MPPLFPTTPAQAPARPAPVAFPKSWVFDFDKGEVVLDSAGRPVEADGTEAYRQWALAALLTPRYRHAIYSRSYGSEIQALLRQNLAPSALESELARDITETLQQDPRTRLVGDFSFVRSGTTLQASFTTTTSRGDSITLTVPMGG